MARRTQRRSASGYRRTSRAGYSASSRRVSRGGARRGTRRAAGVRSSRSAQTIKIVLQQPAAATGSVVLSDAGRLMTPNDDKRSRF